MKICILSTFFLFSSVISFAQKPKGKNVVFVEAGGNGLAISVNYERQLINYPAIVLHAGVGIYPDRDHHMKAELTIPFGINYLLKFNKKSMLDIGFGAVWTKADAKLFMIVDRHEPYINHNYINFVPSIGYRRHTSKNFMWRGSITPVISKEYGVTPFIGFSFGEIF